MIGFFFGGFEHAQYLKISEMRLLWQVRTLMGHSSEVGSVCIFVGEFNVCTGGLNIS